MNDLTKINEFKFGTMSCEVYQDRHGDFFMTREQIGKALEYANPQKAIDKIHKRYQDRLDTLSVTPKLGATDGKKYETRLYTAKGIYEICRHSDKPKANAFYDYVYGILEGLRLGYLKLEMERQSPVWQGTRSLGKQIRKEETEAIKELVEYAKGQGSRNAGRYYISLSRLADAAAGISDRDKSTVLQLNALLMAERMIAEEIKRGIALGIFYREIYGACKSRLAQFQEIASVIQ